MSTVPETAQAIRIEKNGGVEVLEKKTIPLKVSPGEVVIKVTSGKGTLVSIRASR